MKKKNRLNFSSFHSLTFIDGGMGTLLQAAGLKAGEESCLWNISHPEVIRKIHADYVDSGAQVIYANTFGASPLKLQVSAAEREAIITAGVRLAKEAAAGYSDVKVAIDIGPSGRLLAPAGDLSLSDAIAAFAEQIKIGAAAGADLVAIETMGDTRELKAAIIAAKETCSLPIYATVALGEDGKLLTGATVECVAALLEPLGVAAYGFNCGLGPDKLLPYVERLAKVATRPIIVKANAGLPKVIDGKTVFTVGPEEFARHAVQLVAAGASIVGGCCGTTPAHIAAVKKACSGEAIHNPNRSDTSIPRTVISSGSKVLELVPHKGVIIGERINPTGRRALKEAYRNGDTAYILREAVSQVEDGAVALDVNCGVPGVDEAKLLEETIECVQSVVSEPVVIDSSHSEALRRGLRCVNGKPLVNSVNGKQESMDSVLPLVQKYGGAVVALCLDENGIPDTARGRVEIARRIIAEGAKYGLTKNDFVVDALTLAVSAQPNAALITLETVRLLTEELGVNTILGVSNVSFGLPNRPALNAAMLTLAKEAGLSAAIYNPFATQESHDPMAIDVLLARDKDCAAWIAANANVSTAAVATPASAAAANDLAAAIRHGLCADAQAAAAARLANNTQAVAAVMALTNDIVAALEEVGKGFEKGSIFLPQLLMAADAAGAAFSVVKSALPAAACKTSRPIVLATVKGDIHDIGKNIVRSLLENYGFPVIDLGRDVPPERIVEVAHTKDAFLVGLSALMTTTVGAMAETIRQLRVAQLNCKICVGGAVLTADFAASINADFYAKDAMCTVRYAEQLIKS